MTQDTALIQQFDKIIVALEHVRSRPGMYFGNLAYSDFIRGFNMARIILLNVPQYEAVYDETLQDHGFTKNPSFTLYTDLIYQGADPEEAADQHLMVLIATYKKLRHQLSNGQSE